MFPSVSSKDEVTERLAILRETGLVLCRIAPWNCFAVRILTQFSARAQLCNSQEKKR